MLTLIAQGEGWIILQYEHPHTVAECPHIHALTADDYPVLAKLWDNPADEAYNNL
jgi:hypothetical protein